jgi:NADPH:quinone reductase-like Zn-dependent oxidoreductase
MKAIICTKYGPPEVLELREVKKPKPKGNQVLVKIYATAVHSGDCRMRSLNLVGVPLWQRILAQLVLGITKPRKPILGLWLSGEIEIIGKNVKRFQVGDKVYARTPDMQFGAYAQYICLPDKGFIVKKPSNVSYEEAVAIPFGGLTALYFLRKGKIQNGQKVLIYGASGAVGTSAVQIAKYFGADVTGVCSTSNLELVKSLGAKTVIDYSKDDFTEANVLYDIIFDAVGKIYYSNSKKALRQNGKYFSILTSGHAKKGKEAFNFLNKLVEAGDIKPVIDRRWPLDQMVEAHRYVEKGHKKGNVVITVEHEKRTK